MSEKNGVEVSLLRSTIKRVAEFLCGPLKMNHVRIMIIYFLIVSIMELLAYIQKGEIIRVIASRIWLIGGIFCLITIISYIVATFRSDISQKNTSSIVAIIGILLFLIYLCCSINCSEINPNAAIQAADGLNSFSLSDFNYTGKSFRGYPNRQYVLIAIPAFLFGQSITTLHLGFAIPFMLGLLTMYSGVRHWADKRNVSGKYAIIIVMMLFGFRFVTEYYSNFEQAILPISFTMLLIGLFLHLLCKPNILCIFSMAWVGCLCTNVYTPVLASLGLLLVFVSGMTWLLLYFPDKLPFPIEEKVKTALILIAMNVTVIIFFVATLLGHRSDGITKLREKIDIVPFSWTSICDFLTDKNAVFMGFMGSIVVIYIIASLTMQLKIHDFLLSIWVLGVFVATNLMVGYTPYTKPWIMQRALVVVPVIITGITLCLYDLIQKYKINVKNHFIIAIIVSFVLIGRCNFMQVNQSFTYFNRVQPMKYMLRDLEMTTQEKGISHKDKFNFILYTDNVLMQNPKDYFKFLYPNAKVYIGVYGQYPEGIDTSKPTIIYGEKFLANMTPSKDIRLIEYENVRYATTGKWYKIVMENKDM